MSATDTSCLASVQSLLNNPIVSQRESAVIVENSTEMLQKLKRNYLLYVLAIPLLGYIQKKKRNQNIKETSELYGHCRSTHGRHIVEST